MNSINLYNILQEFGLSTCLSVSIFLMMFWLLRSVIQDQRKERDSFHCLISNNINENTKALTDSLEKLKTHDQELDVVTAGFDECGAELIATVELRDVLFETEKFDEHSHWSGNYFAGEGADRMVKKPMRKTCLFIDF